jgi:hypothetical protein
MRAKARRRSARIQFAFMSPSQPPERRSDVLMQDVVETALRYRWTLGDPVARSYLAELRVAPDVVARILQHGPVRAGRGRNVPPA